MNTNTGELARFEKDIPVSFVPLTDAEARKADALLGDKRSIMLPEGHPLRVQVTKREGKPATEKQMRGIRRYYRTWGTEAFWEWCAKNAPDITPESGLSCGQAQRLLTLLDKEAPELAANRLR